MTPYKDAAYEARKQYREASTKAAQLNAAIVTATKSGAWPEAQELAMQQRDALAQMEAASTAMVRAFAAWFGFDKARHTPEEVAFLLETFSLPEPDSIANILIGN